MLIGNQVFGRLVEHYTDATSKAVDWRMVWIMPAGFALAILIIFVLFFRYKPSTQS